MFKFRDAVCSCYHFTYSISPFYTEQIWFLHSSESLSCLQHFCHLTQTLSQKLTRVIFYLDSSTHVVTEQSSIMQLKASHQTWIYRQMLIWFI